MHPSFTPIQIQLQNNASLESIHADENHRRENARKVENFARVSMRQRESSKNGAPQYLLIHSFVHSFIRFSFSSKYSSL